MVPAMTVAIPIQSPPKPNATPLLSVRGLTKHFPLTGGMLGPQPGRSAGGG